MRVFVLSPPPPRGRIGLFLFSILKGLVGMSFLTFYQIIYELMKKIFVLVAVLVFIVAGVGFAQKANGQSLSLWERLMTPNTELGSINQAAQVISATNAVKVDTESPSPVTSGCGNTLTPTGKINETSRCDGRSWVAAKNLLNDGTNLGLGVALVGIAAAIFLLSVAMQRIQDLDNGDIAAGLTVVGSLITGLTVAAKQMAKDTGTLARAGLSMIGMAMAIYILTFALERMSKMDPAKALAGSAAAVVAIVGMTTALKLIDEKSAKAKGFAFLSVGLAVNLFAMAVEKFGKDTVYANFVRSSVITAQAAMRRYLEDGKSEEEIADKMANWKPGVPMERAVDPIAATISKFAKMDEAAKNALLEQLLSLAGKK